ncbi:hypothetical protein CY652_23075 [Burkholderia sp. WAC0059]|uniref:hypothetical protein n=1 Tax=Burkholderia sp. WAC0059 TaxID=2066022 RepID=UPI000C7F290D|nr:hypothetical protein [Burkholderia sp. WAC0059]PLZ00047.1 hypothetical protein CY652_23075 [Burkholderia sp. WAC0059]
MRSLFRTAPAAGSPETAQSGASDEASSHRAQPPARTATGATSRDEAGGFFSKLKPRAQKLSHKLDGVRNLQVDWSSAFNARTVPARPLRPTAVRTGDEPNAGPGDKPGVGFGKKAGFDQLRKKPVADTTEKALNGLAPTGPGATRATRDARAAAAPAQANDIEGFGHWVTRLFPSGVGATDPQAGLQLASRIQALCGTPAGISPAAAHSDAQILAQALSEATHGDPIAARAALERMAQGLDPTSAPADRRTAASTPAPQTGAGPGPAETETLAWRSAQVLSQTASGYDRLRAIAGANWPDPAGPARHAPRIWFRAADTAIRATGFGATPADLAWHAAELADYAAETGQPRPGTHAAAMTQAAEKLWRTGDVSALSRHEKGLLMAGTQGFYEDGQGTDLAAAKGRMLRMVRLWIPRAAEATPMSTLKSTLKNPLRPLERATGHHKNPLGLAKNGIRAANLVTLEKERKKLDQAVPGALGDLRSATESEPFRPHLSRWPFADTIARAERDVVARAELDVWSQRDEAPKYGQQLGDDGLERVAARTVSLVESMPVPSREAGSRELHTWAALRRFADELQSDDPERRGKAYRALRKRLANRSETLDYGKLKAWSKNLPDTDALKEDFAKMRRIARGDGIALKDASPESLHQAFDELIGDIGSGGRVRFADGGVVGVSTRGFSANVANLMHMAGGVFSPQVDLRLSRGRQAFVEYGRSSSSYRVTMGTLTRWRDQEGVGLMVGHDSDVGITQVRAGGAISRIFRQAENTQQRSVSLAVSRRINDEGDDFKEDQARATFRQVNDFLFSARERDAARRAQAAGTQPGAHGNRQAKKAEWADAENALWEDLAEQFLNNDDVSVQWTDQTDHSRRSGTTVSGSVAAKAGLHDMTARVGFQTGLAHETVNDARTSSRDTAGRTRIETQRAGEGSRLTASAGLIASLGNNSAGKGPQGFGLLTTDATVRVRLFDTNKSSRFTLVREAGALVNPVCFLEQEFTNLDAYAKELSSHADLALMLGVDYKKLPVRPQQLQEAIEGGRSLRDYLSEDEQKTALEAGYRKIESYVADLRDNRRDNQRYIHRSRLRVDVARQLDGCADRVAAIQNRINAGQPRETDDADLAALNAQWDALLLDNQSWLPADLKSYDRVDLQRATGLFIGIHAGTEKQTLGEREFLSTSLKLNQLDAMDALWQD